MFEHCKYSKEKNMDIFKMQETNFVDTSFNAEIQDTWKFITQKLQILFMLKMNSSQ